MAELTIDPASIRKALDDFVSSYKPSDTPTQEVGYVATAGDGIAHVTGLPGCMANELLTFEDGTLGLAFNLDAREIGVVILGDFAGIEEGQEVRRTGEVLSVPVGDGYLGRVVDPLGKPLDGLGEIQGIEGRRILEAQAPDVMHRHPVDEPLSTGLKAIDAMTPIGRGQRQLIIGDRQTGKTAIAIDTIINQKANWESGDPKKQVRCIYVAIGQKGSTIASVKQSLEDAGAMEYTTIVASPAADSAGFKYIAPYTGSAIGQHWMYHGKHVLIVFDDLSKQAEAYRAVSLLLRRPPGRFGVVGGRHAARRRAGRHLALRTGRAVHPVARDAGGAGAQPQEPGQQLGGVVIEPGCAAAEKSLATDGSLLAQAGQRGLQAPHLQRAGARGPHRVHHQGQQGHMVQMGMGQKNTVNRRHFRQHESCFPAAENPETGSKDNNDKSRNSAAYRDAMVAVQVGITCRQSGYRFRQYRIAAVNALPD